MGNNRFNGKAIYNPSGKAGEYSDWACNFYTGCSNNCDYCYCKKGVMSYVWSDTPKLKKCFRDDEEAISIFEKELLANLGELQEHGLFFSFTTDPMLPQTIDLTVRAIKICVHHSVNVKILTKRADFAEKFFRPLCSKSALNENLMHIAYTRHVAFGFTLTGHDELESNASSNSDRIEAMKILHEGGYKTFASIEPIIDLEGSLSMIISTVGFCDLYKVGLLSGKKYNWRELRGFMLACTSLKSKFYFKDSFISQADLDRANLPQSCVGRDYDMFKM